MNVDEPFGGLITGARGAVLALLLRTGAHPTGRRVHSLLDGDHSLWSVQQALKALVELGIVEQTTVGPSIIYSINEDHATVPSLRRLVDPVGMLTEVIEAHIDTTAVDAVILFGSTATGAASADSDIDLAVIGSSDWDESGRLAQHVHAGMGNPCDVLVFTPEEFDAAVRRGEPVVRDILRDGIPLVGALPHREPRVG
ncbi:nucleotidyltransferase domain-containing protein [Brevibacterium sp. LS14]|nr:nucleotidyltransferase domain-containing protein [Brevibacterium sp. LS14]